MYGMYGRFYAQKLHYFRSRFQKATVRVRVKSSFFFPQITFQRYKAV